MNKTQLEHLQSDIDYSEKVRLRSGHCFSSDYSEKYLLLYGARIAKPLPFGGISKLLKFKLMEGNKTY